MEEKTTLVKKQTSINLDMIIPTSVEEKIRICCSQSWNTEWSGVLFFTYKGDFDKGLQITCKDICVMNIGSSGYTEFDMNPDVISYMTNYNLLDCQMGLIHSHNNMPTFFSCTDQQTLKEEGKDRNNFVSLIVNNVGTYTAAITRKYSFNREVKEKYIATLFDRSSPERIHSYTEKNNIIEYYDLNIIKKSKYFDELKVRFDELKQQKAEQVNNLLPSVDTRPKNNFPLFSNSNSNLLYEQTPKDLSYSSKDLDSLVDSKDDELGTSMQIVVDVCIAQILTGDIQVDVSKFDVIKYLSTMNTTYEKSFGNTKESLKNFEQFITNHIDNIIEYNLSVYDESVYELATVEDPYEYLARNIVNTLITYPKNKYLQIIINNLNKY